MDGGRHMKYIYEYEYRNSQGRLYKVRSGGTFDSYEECDRILSDACSDAVDRGYTDVQGDILEVEG
jgi:hypothetical protein